MRTSLFRQEVIETSSERDLGEVHLAISITQTTWTVWAVCMGLAVLIWIFNGHYTRRVHVSGVLVPETGLINVSADSAGVIDKLFVKEGSRVRKGDVLASFTGEHFSRSLGKTSANVSEQLMREADTLEQDIRDSQTLQIQQTEDNHRQQRMLQGQLKQLDAQLDIESKQMSLAQDLVNKWQPLLQGGYVASIQVEEQQATVLSDQSQYKSLIQQRYGIQQQLTSLRDQLIQLPLATAAKLNEFRRQLSQIEQALAQNEVNRDSVLHATTSGIISSVLAKPGTSVTLGQPLLAIVPEGVSLQAQVLVPSQAVGFIRQGTEVAIHYQSFPYQKFGVQKGKVLTVSRSALLPNEVSLLLGGSQPLSTDPLYLVKVALATQSVRAYDHDEALKPGMALDADLLLDSRRIIEWIFEPLLGMGRRWSKSS